MNSLIVLLISFILMYTIYHRLLSPTMNRLDTVLTVVSRFENIEEYYLSLRSQNLDEEFANTKLQTVLKKMDCQDILSSQYFKMRQEKYFDIDNDNNRTKLLNEHLDIFNFNFRWEKRIHIRGQPNVIYNYENPYRVRSFKIRGEDQQDFMFTCVAEDSNDSRRIKEYFVTRQYNVNLVSNAPPIFGRFVFERNSSNVLELLALAEESAKEIGVVGRMNFVEAAFAETYADPRHGPISTPNMDPICKLTDGEKLRLCTSIFGSNKFRIKGLKFIPTLDNVHRDCIKRQISLTTLGNGTFVGWIAGRYLSGAGVQNPRFEEWMIGCSGATRGGDLIVYYVSRSIIANNIFLYVDINDGAGRVKPYNMYNRVSVVDNRLP